MSIQLCVHPACDVRVHLAVAVRLPSFHLVKTDECCDANVVLLQEVDAPLTTSHRVDHDVFESATCCRDCYVILVVDRSEVALKPSQTILLGLSPSF